VDVVELGVDEVLSVCDASTDEVLPGCDVDASDGWLFGCEDDVVDDKGLSDCEVDDTAGVADFDTMVKRPLKV
jgi:hypothetical protein